MLTVTPSSHLIRWLISLAIVIPLPFRFLLDYITNPDKTDEKLLVSSFGCSPETADLEFALTREAAKKNGMDKGDNLAFHLIQSFKPGEVDAENAHHLGQQFADEVLKGKYEYVISTHVDKNHIHSHII